LKVLHVVGARPNIPKVAPVWRALRGTAQFQVIVDTGQHYDDQLFGSLWRQFELPDADHSLGVGSATHAVQTARLMERLEPVFVSERPNWVVVYGDVNSTLAASLVASKLGLPIAHVEAGLRSGDWSMPEEVNRVVTDRLSDLLLAPSDDAVQALLREGELPANISMVGNVMVDSLLAMRSRAAECGARARVPWPQYGVVTLHRPSNVDNPARLERVMAVLDAVAATLPLVLPVHPRTATRLSESGIAVPRGVMTLEPQPYLEMLDLLANASAIITDSGGVQEEATALGVPCYTLRPNTERPVTITHGTNQLVPEPEQLLAAMQRPIDALRSRRPPGWDGTAALRVRDALLNVAALAG
jgi:UDP-N-acetylglucosamine 2-epimerase (non-hydrolysing)